MYYVSCHHILIHYDCFIPGLTDCKDEVSSIGVTSMRPPFASNYVTDSMLAPYYARGRCGNGQNNPVLYVSKKKRSFSLVLLITFYDTQYILDFSVCIFSGLLVICTILFGFCT